MPELEAFLVQNNLDLISFGVPYLSNPDLDERFPLNTPLNEVDNTTFYGGDEKGYTDYHFLKDVEKMATAE